MSFWVAAAVLPPGLTPTADLIALDAAINVTRCSALPGRLSREATLLGRADEVIE
jgi:hypothetical protein